MTENRSSENGPGPGVINRGEGPATGHAYVLAPAAGAAQAKRSEDFYAARASFLERLVGEAGNASDGLRSFEVRWLGRPGNDPVVHLVAMTSGLDPEVAVAAGRGLLADLTAALEDHSPIRWRAATVAQRRQVDRALQFDQIAQLQLGNAGEPSRRLELYPLRASTVERALRRVREPVAVRVRVLATPRRRQIPLRTLASSNPFGRLVPAGVTSPDEGQRALRADAAERWQFLVRVEVRAEHEVPRDLLGAIASDIRGAGSGSVGLLISGVAAAVDAEWSASNLESVARSIHATWPADTALLNLREAACLLALPSGADVDDPPVDRLARVPARLPRRGVVVGSAAGGRRPVAIAPTDFLRHLFVIGSTGSGKSTCQLNIVDQVIRDPAKPAVFVLDPHGSLVTQIMGTLAPSEIERVVLFDPSDHVAPMTWNPLACASPSESAAIVDAFISWAWEMWDPHRTMHAGMGPIAEQTLRAVLHTVITKPGSTLVDALELVQDDRRAGDYLRSVSDPPTRRFWEMRASMSDKDKSEYANYLTSKLSPFAHDQALRAVVAHPSSTLDIREAIAGGRIVLAPLRKAELGSETTTALIRLLKRFLWREISARGPGGPEQRRVVVVIDEFTNYASELDEVMLAEARKFSTSVVLATQNLGQARDSLIESVAANAASMVAYRIGLHDSVPVAAMLGDPAIAHDLTRLPNFKAVARIPFAGEPLPPLLIDSPKPLRGFSEKRLAEVRAASRARYGLGSEAEVAPESRGRPEATPNRRRSGDRRDPSDPDVLAVPITAAGIQKLLESSGIPSEIDSDGDVYLEGLGRGGFFMMVRGQDVRFYAEYALHPRRSRADQLELVNRINAELRIPRATIHTRDGGSGLIFDWYLPAKFPVPKEDFVGAVRRFADATKQALDLDKDEVLA